MRTNHIGKLFATVLLSAISLCLLVASCKSVGGKDGLPVVASFNITNQDGSQLIGTMRYDGNRFVAFGVPQGQMELWMKANGFPLLGPFAYDGRSAVFYTSDPKFAWHGDLNAPLPANARPLFREVEIAQWNLPFEPEGS